VIRQKEESEIATTDATITTEVLRRVEEENGRVRRVLAHRHLRQLRSFAIAQARSRRARGRHGVDG
jgi:hypothetical protein